MERRRAFFCAQVGRTHGKAVLLFLLVLLTNSPVQAQKEANIWFFGHGAGLDFSSGVPKGLTGPMDTPEGSAVMSDQHGKLLFYTDGKTVWNGNHEVMKNGRDLNGEPSATQSAVIVPWPGTLCQKYFVFTLNSGGNDPSRSLNYSVVDMSLDGGDVDVKAKNVNLPGRFSEKLTAVTDAVGTGFWVIAHYFDGKVQNEQNRTFMRITSASTALTPMRRFPAQVLPTPPKKVGERWDK